MADDGPSEEVDPAYLRYLQDQASLEGGEMVQPPDFKGLWTQWRQIRNQKVTTVGDEQSTNLDS